MNEVDSLRTDYAKQLWTLSSAVAAFSVLQTIAYVYKLADSSFRDQVSDGFAYIAPAIVVATAIYCGAIFWIDRRQSGLLISIDPQLSAVVNEVAKLKLAAVLICGGGALLVSAFIRYCSQAA
ncbi:MAG: hypothetical protein ACJ8IR_08205 [Alphaproteobacteria bacterium]